MVAPLVERRLAAILAADVVGYARLVEHDEAGTLVRLKTLRTCVIEPVLARHGGRIVKLMGDGALVEFPGAVAAVEAAVEVQRAVAEQERATPETEPIRFRVGISLGDVVHEDGDLFGEGVNLAARLQALAEPGGICLARNVEEQVRNRLDVGLTPMGRQRLKNIAGAVEVWRVGSTGAQGTGARRLSQPLWLAFLASAGRPSSARWLSAPTTRWSIVSSGRRSPSCLAPSMRRKACAWSNGRCSSSTRCIRPSSISALPTRSTLPVATPRRSRRWRGSRIRGSRRGSCRP